MGICKDVSFASFLPFSRGGVTMIVSVGSEIGIVLKVMIVPGPRRSKKHYSMGEGHEDVSKVFCSA